MTHDDAIATLLASAPDAPPTAARPDAATRERAAAHVARCSDCWASVAGLARVESGDAERMRVLFGCEDVQGALFELVALPAATLASAHPDAARHLAWCHACRDRFAELVAVEREWEARPRWTEVLTSAGERVREVAGHLVVRAGRVVAGLVAVPEGFVVVAPVPAPAALRNGAIETPSEAPLVGRSARFDLGDSGVAAELDVESADDGRVTLALRLASETADLVSVRLYEVRPDGEALVARHTLRGAEPVVVRGLWPGAFVVELHEPQGEERYRMRLDIGPGT